MKIVIVFNRKMPVVEYGGTERVVWYLAKELSAMGHSVTLLAGKGTRCSFARVIEFNPAKELYEQIPNDADVVHYHSCCDSRTTKPYIMTVHGNEVGHSVDHAVYVSRNHAERYGSTHYVYNGLDWDDYGTVDFNRPRDYYHFLGKAAWKVKNVRGAIRMIDNIDGARLKVMGGHRFNFKMGWRFTFSPNVRFYGMVGGERKLELLNGSKGLIFPVLWDEPFGLAITESLYFGAAVYGTQRGSLPELVTREVGALSNDESELTELIRSGDFSPRRCHDYAVELFNARMMAEGYLAKYEKVMNDGVLKAML